MLYSFHNYFVKQGPNILFHGYIMIYLVIHLLLYLVIYESLEIIIELSQNPRLAK